MKTSGKCSKEVLSLHFPRRWLEKRGFMNKGVIKVFSKKKRKKDKVLTEEHNFSEAVSTATKIDSI